MDGGQMEGNRKSNSESNSVDMSDTWECVSAAQEYLWVL